MGNHENFYFSNFNQRKLFNSGNLISPVILFWTPYVLVSFFIPHLFIDFSVIV